MGVSYFKTQWWRLLCAVLCLVGMFFHALQIGEDPTTIEAMSQVLGNIISAGLHLAGFAIWAILSFIDYNSKCIQLLEKKQARDDAMYELGQELLKANQIDRERAKQIEDRLKKLEGHNDEM